MGATYDLDFGKNTPYAHVLTLLGELATPGTLVIDLGAGHGALGEGVEANGFTYVGVDIDIDGVAHINERGFEGHYVDLADQDNLVKSLTDIAADRTVGAIVGMDIIEHMSDSAGFVHQLRLLTVALGRPPLIVSVPNVAHFDVGAKLVNGRWDVTPSGLLDRTHLAFYTEQSLTEAMKKEGFYEASRNDFSLFQSDQNFPELLPAIAPKATLATYLRSIRDRADAFGYVNQFVRAYTCGDVTPNPQPEVDRPGVSVVMRTQGKRLDLLSEALLTLAGQTNTDFEVLLMVHSPSATAEADVRQTVGVFSPNFSRRVEIVSVQGGDRSRPLNEALRIANGDYIAFLDDDDVVTSDWIETFLSVGNDNPGRIIRAVTADQTVRKRSQAPGYDILSGPVVDPARIDFDMIRHLETNRTPICSFAVPRETIEAYNIEFDESLLVLEDWHFLVRCALVCGVADSRKVTSIYRRWDDAEASWHSIDRSVWARTRRAIQHELDAEPVLLPAGSVSAISELIEAAFRPSQRKTSADEKKLAKELAQAKRRIKALETSTSWKVTRPLRAVVRVFRG